MTTNTIKNEDGVKQYLKLPKFFRNGIEQRFFSIVRIFSMLIASIAVIICAAALIWAIQQFTSSANTDIAEPEINYQKYKEQLEDNHAQRYEDGYSPAQQSTEDKEAQLERESEQLAIRKEFDSYYKNIAENISDYAKTMGDEPLKDYPKLNDHLFKVLVTQNDNSFTLTQALEDFTDTLKDQAEELKNLNNTDVRRVTWLQSLNWFLGEIDSQILAEENRIEKEHNLARRDRSSALQTIAISGVAFLVFMLFVIILVLLKIENNTRSEVIS